ncbi:Rna-Binding Protein 6 [Manis pentadactyla]|nr:Rna-Binding Protein 6 [Manis pentadactyla]
MWKSQRGERDYSLPLCLKDPRGKTNGQMERITVHQSMMKKIPRMVETEPYADWLVLLYFSLSGELSTAKVLREQTEMYQSLFIGKVLQSVQENLLTLC